MDNAFPTAAYPSLTSANLAAARERAADRGDTATVEKMTAELGRRIKVAAGDRSVMTPGERLRNPA